MYVNKRESIFSFAYNFDCFQYHTPTSSIKVFISVKFIKSLEIMMSTMANREEDETGNTHP